MKVSVQNGRNLLPVTNTCCPGDPTNSCAAAPSCFAAGVSELKYIRLFDYSYCNSEMQNYLFQIQATLEWWNSRYFQLCTLCGSANTIEWLTYYSHTSEKPNRTNTIIKKLVALLSQNSSTSFTMNISKF